MNAYRPVGDYYSTGPAEWRCDDCGKDEWACLCKDAPRCVSCDDELPDSGSCAACTEPAKLDASWTIHTHYHGKGRGSVAA